MPHRKIYICFLMGLTSPPGDGYVFFVACAIRGTGTGHSEEDDMHYCEDCGVRRPEAELVVVEFFDPDFELYFCKGGCS